MAPNENADSRLTPNVRIENRENSSAFTLTSLNDLLAEPEEQVAYVWDRTLPVGGLSICAAKPKVGKSTFARNLAVAVASGADFFGRATAKGRVVLLCLEEKRSEIGAHFRRMGCHDVDIHVYTGPTPIDALFELAKVIAAMKPTLVIIDPLSRFVRLTDFNQYGEVTRALEPLIDLARATGCHILALHHSGKGEREGGDAVLGSTGFFGAVDTLIEMRRSGRTRTIKTTQRYGEDMSETLLQLNPDTGVLTECGDAQSQRTAQYEGRVIDALGDERLTEQDIKERVGGNQTYTAMAIRSLYDLGLLERTGTGKKGDPYRYYQPPNAEQLAVGYSILDSTLIGNRANTEAAPVA